MNVYTTYLFSELSEEAQKKAIDEVRFDVMNEMMNSYSSDYMASMDEFAKITGVYATHWDVGYCGSRFSVDSDLWFYDDLGMDDVMGELLFRYVDKRILPRLWKGRYLGHRKEPFRAVRSKVTGGYDDCPLTGCCTDCALIEPLLEYVANWPKYSKTYSLQDLMEDCYGKFFKWWRSEYEFWATDEAVESELMEDNTSYEFHEDGRRAQFR